MEFRIWELTKRKSDLRLEAKNSDLRIIEGTSGRSLEYLQKGTREVRENMKLFLGKDVLILRLQLKKYPMYLTKSKPLEILLIGDIIVDEYVATEPLGISAEAPVIVVKELETKRYLGGAGVVAKHLSSLGAEVTL